MKKQQAEAIAIVWFRQDLRLDDNTALLAAINTKLPILPLYIFDQDKADTCPIGDASRIWLHHSLLRLNDSLNGKLCFEKGQSLSIFNKLLTHYPVAWVFWNRCYEPWRIKQDTALKSHLKKQNIKVKTFNANLLFDPLRITKDDGQPYKVFTPFYRHGCLKKHVAPDRPQATPKTFPILERPALTLDQLALLPRGSWTKNLLTGWLPGEHGAKKRLNEFLQNGLNGYKKNRDIPSRSNVSRLAPHLHFGEISPRTLWHSVKEKQVVLACEDDGEHFLSELGWREFSQYLLFHFPTLPSSNLKPQFDAFPWCQNRELLNAWQQGQTGFPFVDAGMRELWQTGYMHNRVRMVVASFLVKNLMIHWRHGAEWFQDTLFDADMANNSASWQWVAGCGTDAAPYFRIFNPVVQGQKFDPDGIYVKQYLPELATMPKKYLHNPFDAPPTILSEANVQLGHHYPKPVIDLNYSRKLALESYQSIKSLDMD